MDIERFQHAIILRNAGKVQEALQEFEALASLSPDLKDQINLIGNQANCLVRLGRLTEARARWEEAEALGSDVYSKFLEAWLCVEEGRRQDAVRKFAQLLKYPIEPETPDFNAAVSIDLDTYLEALERLVGLLVHLERYGEAVPWIERGLELSEGGRRKRLCFQFGLCDYCNEQWRSAEEKFIESLPLEHQGPWWLQAQYYLGICHFQMGKLELAEEELIRGLPEDAKDPFWVKVQYQLGVVRFRRGDYRNAKLAFELAAFFEDADEWKQHISRWLAAVRSKLGERERDS